MNLGKPTRRTMSQVICRLTGAQYDDILAGPELGMDSAVVMVPGGQVLVTSTDPVSFIPSLGATKSAWLSVHGTASDLATSGLPPRYAVFDLNLPPSMSDRTLREFWRGIHETCRELKISIIGGHTGRFQGCDYTVVGGVTMFTVGDDNSYVTSAMGRNGDDIIATKSAGIEASAVLALSFPRTLRKAVGEQTVEKAGSLFTRISVVNDALSAIRVGHGERGIRAMHDATEGGVLTAAMELADASGLKAKIDSESIPVEGETRDVCKFFGIDPLISLGQGCLLIASGPSKTQEIEEHLRKKDIGSTVIGKLTRNRAHSLVHKGRARTLRYPTRDPYWQVYANALKRRLH